MKIIVAGSRTIDDYELVNKHLNKITSDITEIVSGTANGADKLGEQWAVKNNKKITRFPADWDKYGKSAGYRRNAEMAKYADMAVIFWDGKSLGSMHMYNLAKKEGLETILINTAEQEDYVFPCGCVLPKNENGGLDIEFTVEGMGDFDCPKTWQLISEGDTLGVFQLESQLGQSLSKKLEPEHIEHLSALAAIIRPGSMESIRDGKSITQHYIDRRHGEEDVVASHPALESVLSTTLQEMIYQENAINIAKEIAGFSLVEANLLRKAIGKKLAEKMKELETTFLEGCKKTGKVNEEEAKEIFESIRKSQRYSFNKCLHPKTLVTLRGGCIKSIDALKPDDEIEVPYEHEEDEEIIPKYRKVLKIYNTGKQRINEYRISDGSTIKCTAKHKIMNSFGRVITIGTASITKAQIMMRNSNETVYSWSKLGEMDSMDIEIESKAGDEFDHMFYANGDIICSNSHSVSYAINSYMTAYAKAHFPLVFFKNYLKHSIGKPKPFEEMQRLVFNAKLHDIEIQPPQIKYKMEDFEIRDGLIYYGLSNIRGVGSSATANILKLYEQYGDLPWIEFLFKIGINVNKRCIKSLIGAGGFSEMGMARSRMLFEHDLVLKLTKKEQQWIIDNLPLSELSLLDIFESILVYEVGRGKPISSKKRHLIVSGIFKTLIEPPHSLHDTPQWLSTIEESLMGVSLTCTKLDGCNINRADTTCKEFVDGKEGMMIIAGEIGRINEHITKQGEFMAFISMHDNTAAVESVLMFPKTWKLYKHACELGLPIIFYGKRGKNNGFIVDKCFSLE